MKTRGRKQTHRGDDRDAMIYKRCVGLEGWHHCDIHIALARPLPFRDSVRQTSYEPFSLSVSRKAGANLRSAWVLA
jgi:uncharacterized protein YjhX (UPF0386 family)